MKTDYIQQSYALQAASEELMKMPSLYTAPSSIDCWRHSRMLASVSPLVAALPAARWMTVGDGRYGSDAAFLKKLGVQVLATSLTDDRLRRAHELGFIDRFEAQNAERLSHPDDSFDFVFCKEAYHHFPRPPIALYEMLRVSRVGVVMIEPCDNSRVLDAGKRLAKRLLRGDSNFDYEPSGNFLYRLNIRELGKLMCAMGRYTLAVRKFNDFYMRSLAGAEARGRNRAFMLTKAGVLTQDLLARSRLLGWGLVCVVVFKTEPTPQLEAALEADDFEIIRLPKNPYTGG